MYHYVYLLEDIETKEFYIGSRSSELHPSIDPYLGSMKVWKPNKSKLKKIILKDDFIDRESALEYEALEILKNIENSLNRNYSIPGKKFYTKGFVTVKDDKGKCFNISIYDQRYLSGELKHHNIGNKNTILDKEKNSRIHLGHKRQSGEKNSQFGSKWMTNGTENKRLDNNLDLPDGWRLGKSYPQLKGLKWITNGIENKRLNNNLDLLPGWKFGKTQNKNN